MKRVTELEQLRQQVEALSRRVEGLEKTTAFDAESFVKTYFERMHSGIDALLAQLQARFGKTQRY